MDYKVKEHSMKQKIRVLYQFDRRGLVERLHKLIDNEKLRRAEEGITMKKQSWKEQVRKRQPDQCLGCLNQCRLRGEITCSNLAELLSQLTITDGSAKCFDRVTR